MLLTSGGEGRTIVSYLTLSPSWLDPSNPPFSLDQSRKGDYPYRGYEDTRTHTRRYALFRRDSRLRVYDADLIQPYPPENEKETELFNKKNREIVVFSRKLLLLHVIASCPPPPPKVARKGGRSNRFSPISPFMPLPPPPPSSFGKRRGSLKFQFRRRRKSYKRRKKFSHSPFVIGGIAVKRKRKA